MTTCTCDNCGFTCDEADLTRPLSETPDLNLRLEAGSTVPAAECPECRSFTYLNPTTYTVLLRPDYIADEFGKDTYLAHITDGERSLYRWQYRITGGFEKALWDTIVAADGYNLDAIAKGFPTHIAAYRRFAHESGYWDALKARIEGERS